MTSGVFKNVHRFNIDRCPADCHLGQDRLCCMMSFIWEAKHPVRHFSCPLNEGFWAVDHGFNQTIHKCLLCVEHFLPGLSSRRPSFHQQPFKQYQPWIRNRDAKGHFISTNGDVRCDNALITTHRNSASPAGHETSSIVPRTHSGCSGIGCIFTVYFWNSNSSVMSFPAVKTGRAKPERTMIPNGSHGRQTLHFTRTVGCRQAGRHAGLSFLQGSNELESNHRQIELALELRRYHP
ncbi:hypothetical protein BJ742DRAFT_832246 [Cladochytrium replicatum]|nr:hypothetical protein BJ742DRAFT_832246 [Cladochytrium replicatum]